jgi:two-component system sensor histidine kinase MprB
MTLHRRITLIAAGAVAIAVGLAMLVAYFGVRNQLLGQIDSSLRAQAAQDTTNSYQHPPSLSPSAGGSAPYEQMVLADGKFFASAENDVWVQTPRLLPISKHTAEVASGTEPAFLDTITVHGIRLRVYTFPALDQVYGSGTSFQPVAIQVARPLGATTDTLSTLRWVFAVVFLLVVLLAVLIARFATHKALSPLQEVTATAETITETEDLEQRLAIRRPDEVGQLAARFNQMLERLARSRAALDDSVTAQRQLVADASHELRTPVTSLRTNAEILMEAGAQLDPEDRRHLLEDVVEQTEELSTLVADLIEVGRGALPDSSMEDERLDELMQDAIARARRNSPQTQYVVTLAPVLVHGNAARLSRAINNLLDNAARHTDTGTMVEVTVDAAGLTVRDHGSGIAEADLPHIFDRFYRGASSRGKQGSGLGLAIVRQIAEQHQGSVTAANAPDGGAIFTLKLPTEPADDPAAGSYETDPSETGPAGLGASETGPSDASTVTDG